MRQKVRNYDEFVRLFNLRRTDLLKCSYLDLRQQHGLRLSVSTMSVFERKRKVSDKTIEILSNWLRVDFISALDAKRRYFERSVSKAQWMSEKTEPVEEPIIELEEIEYLTPVDEPLEEECMDEDFVQAVDSTKFRPLTSFRPLVLLVTLITAVMGSLLIAGSLVIQEHALQIFPEAVNYVPYLKDAGSDYMLVSIAFLILYFCVEKYRG